MSSCVFYLFLFLFIINNKKSGELCCFADLVCSDLGSGIIFLGYNPPKTSVGPLLRKRSVDLAHIWSLFCKKEAKGDARQILGSVESGFNFRRYLPV